MPVEYNIELRGNVTLEGVPADPHDCYLLQEVEGIDGPEIRDQIEPRPDRDGDDLGPQFAGGQQLVISVLIVSPTRAGLRDRERALRSAVRAGTGTWVARLTGRQQDPEPLELPVRVAGTFPFRSPDSVDHRGAFMKPAKFGLRSPSATWSGSSRNAVQVDPPASSGGLVFPLVFPMSFFASSAPGTVIVGAGDARAWPVLKVHGPVQAPVLEHLSSGATLWIATNVPDGGVLEVDTAAKTLLLGGESRYQDLDRGASGWWGIDPGVNEVRFRAAAFSGAARLVVEWRDSYL